MGHSERLFADPGGLSEHDVAQLADNGLARPPAPSGGVFDGIVLRNGEPMRFTLNAAKPADETDGALPEQIAIATLLVASFIGPIWYLLG